MDHREVQSLFEGLNMWQRGDQRAPHKPLLLLYALGRLAAEGERLIRYEEVDRDLKPLLKAFGPVRKSYHPEYPFWHLQTDRLWEVEASGPLQIRESGSSATRGSLLEQNAAGGLTEPLFAVLGNDSVLLTSIADFLLEQNFPTTLHDDIRAAVGLDYLRFSTHSRQARNPDFRTRVLAIYAYRCAICDVDLRIGDQSVGLEAAHIKWHQAGGPDSNDNGLALCALHHKLLDAGAMTLSDDHLIVVSDMVHGNQGVNEWALRYHQQPLNTPTRRSDFPSPAFLSWHRREVFKGLPR